MESMPPVDVLELPEPERLVWPIPGRARGRAMAAVRSVLVVGGGAAGMTAAICLRRRRDRCRDRRGEGGVKALGSGLTMVGATLRALRTLGLTSLRREVRRPGFGL